MRLTDVLGCEVFNADGESLGRVRDACLKADGPPVGEFGPALRLHALLVGRGSTGGRLGLARDSVRGPWLLKLVFGRRPRHRVPWTDIESMDRDTIRLRRDATVERWAAGPSA